MLNLGSYGSNKSNSQTDPLVSMSDIHDLVFGTWSKLDVNELGEDEIKRLNNQRVLEFYGKESSNDDLFHVPEHEEKAYFVKSKKKAIELLRIGTGDLVKSQRDGLYYPKKLHGLAAAFPDKPYRANKSDSTSWHYKDPSKQHTDNNFKDFKKPYLKQPYSFEQMQEWIRCSQDIFYWISKYGAITNNDGEVIYVTLYPYQVQMIKNMLDNRFSINMLARRMGKSICVTLYLSWVMLFKKNHKVGIVAHEGRKARDVLSEVRKVLANQPDFIQAGAVTLNNNNIALDNGSTCQAFSSDPDALRGTTLSTIYVDECSFIDRWEDTWATIQPIATASIKNRLIMTSTPRGKNHFYELYAAAEKDENGYVPLKALWYSLPANLYNDKGLFDDGLQFETTGRKTGDKFDQEQLCSFEANPEPTLIPMATIQELEKLVKWYEKDEVDQRVRVDDVVQYRAVMPDAAYVIVGDTSEGKLKDYHSIQVFDVTNYPAKPAEQIAVLHNNNLRVDELVTTIATMSMYYNNAYVYLEQASTGGIITERLMNGETPIATKTTKSGNEQGFDVMKGNNKHNACVDLQTLICNGNIVIRHGQTIEELKHFTENGTSWEAETGYHDDLVMTLATLADLLMSPSIHRYTEAVSQEKPYEEGALCSGSDYSLSQKSDFDYLNDDDNYTPIGAFVDNGVEMTAANDAVYGYSGVYGVGSDEYESDYRNMVYGSPSQL
ncbi:TPA: terminase family protein [Vibrio parahaemolyticus]|nr:terminase family protein [Vibrio parahaemolyticus]